MSFLKKIFGKTAEPAGLRNRAPRVKVTGLHRLTFVPPSSSSVLLLSNVSTSGMAVYHDKSQLWKADSEVVGTLRVDREAFELRARVRHVSDVLAGCEFVDPMASLSRAIEAYLRIEILALSMQKVNPAYMKADSRGETLWFTDGQQNELFCVRDAAGVVAFHMSFLGNFVEGGRDKELKGGIINEGVETEAKNHKGSALIDMNRALPPETIGLATTFVQHVELMPAELRQMIEQKLKAGINPGK